jgi:hypothetical protein
MTKLPTLRAKYGEQIGVELFFSFPEIQDEQRTFLDADAVSGVSSLSANGINFSIGQYIVIGQPGALKTEIIQIHAATAPTSTTITLAGVTSFPHNRGDIIRFIPYNQITPSESTDGGTTYTPLSAIEIRADSSETYLNRPFGLSTYFYKFTLTNGSNNSASSDAILATGFADNTIGSVKRRALRAMGEQIGDLITDQDLNDWLYEARRTMDQQPSIFRFTFRQSFDTIIGQCLSGAWTVPAPADLRDRNTYKNILGIRFGRQNRPCIYQDRVRFQQNYLNVAHSTLNGAVTVGASSITLVSTHDFDDNGSLSVAGGAVGTLHSNIAYTGNNRATNTLTGVTEVPAAGYITGLDVWQNANFMGLPSAYTIDSGVLKFDVPFYDQLDGRNIIMDYYKQVPVITSDSQTFDEPFYDEYVAFLRYKIKYKKANGKIDKNSDPDYIEWMEGVMKVIAQETISQKINFVPDVEGFLSATQ